MDDQFSEYDNMAEIDQILNKTCFIADFINYVRLNYATKYYQMASLSNQRQ